MSYIRIIDGETVPTTTAVAYTAPSAVSTVIHRMSLSNYSTSTAMVTIYLVPSGQSLKNDYLVCRNKVIPVDESRTCYEVEGQVIEASGTLQYVCDMPDSVSAVCSGVELAV